MLKLDEVMRMQLFFALTFVYHHFLTFCQKYNL